MDQPDKIANSELVKRDQDKAVAPHAQEIEYALILQRMINLVNEDPEEMRVAIYQLARARLKADASWADEVEQERLANALETAIKGVEKFSVTRNERERLQPAHPAAQIGSSVAGASSPTSVATVVPVTLAAEDIFAPRRVTPPFDPPPVLDVRRRALVSMLGPICLAILLFFAVASLAYYKQQLPLLGGRLNVFKPIAPPTASPSIEDTSPKALAPLDRKSATGRPNSLPFPVPTNYGMYALNNGALSELSALQIRVPDKRIAMSTPVTEPSRTTLADGKAKFILFRRNLAGNAPERVDVRVVARVNRVLTFDSRGKPGFSPVSDAWNIRNITHEFRVRPIAGNPEMLLVQSENPDFTLPAGRYILVVKDQGYDFTVAGKVTDVAQCLERTDAANGSFFSECPKP
jgi:hypothetical protein